MFSPEKYETYLGVFETTGDLVDDESAVTELCLGSKLTYNGEN